MSQGTTRRRFTKEFKSQAVELSRQPGMTVARAAADLGVTATSLHRWRKELAENGDDAFRGHGVRTAADAENHRLKRELAEVKMHLDILKKATAFFARNAR